MNIYTVYHERDRKDNIKQLGCTTIEPLQSAHLTLWKEQNPLHSAQNHTYNLHNAQYWGGVEESSKSSVT